MRDTGLFAKRLFGGGALALVILIGTLVASTVATARVHNKYRGEFGGEFPTSGGTYDPSITGTALMKVGVATTKVKVELEGLIPGIVYSSHLHNRYCADGGGGHYQNEEGVAVDPFNELWLTSFDDGFGIMVAEGQDLAIASGATAWAARTTSDASNALSVVVHAPGGARVACADLVLDQTLLN